MSAEGHFPLGWRASIEGDADVKTKMEALLDVAERGKRASEENIVIARDARREYFEQGRSMTALIGQWRLAHPELGLLTRGFASLGAVSHLLFNSINAINLMFIASAHQAETRKALTDDIRNLRLEIDQMPDSPQKIKLIEDLNKKLEELAKIDGSKIGNEIRNIGIGVGIFTGALAAIGPAMKSISALTVVLGTIGIGAPVIMAVIAAVAAIYVAFRTNFLGIRTDVLEPFFKTTTDALDAWSKDTEKTFADWDKVSAEDIEDWIQRTAVGISVWVGATGKIFDRWVDKVLALVSRLAEEFGKQIDKMVDEAILSIFRWADESAKIIDKAVDDIIKSITDLYHKLVGGSIWTDMLEQMQDVSKDKLGGIKEQFTSFKDIIAQAMTGTGDSFTAAVGQGAISLSGAATSLKGSIDKLVSVQEATNALSNTERNIAVLQSQQERIGLHFGDLTDEDIQQQKEITSKIADEQKKRNELISFATGAAGISMSEFNTLPAGVKEQLIGQGILSQAGMDATGQALIPGKIIKMVRDNMFGAPSISFSAVRPGRDDAEQQFLEETGFMGGRRQSADIPSMGPISRNPRLIQIINNIGGSVITERDLATKIAETIARDTQGLIR